MSRQPGTKLGRFEVISALGAGGMGEVYRAKDIQLGREVAIKLLLPKLSADPERLARFEREARFLASLNHPNIATLHGFEKEGNTSFLVMELVPGETLADRLARGPIPIEEAIALFLQIAAGLEVAHEQGVIHRDLKPANLKISGDGGVKILDFGLAKAMSQGLGAGADLTQAPTMTVAATARGEIMGTVAYMSPEQAAGRALDPRTDVWAFGVCLWEALTGDRAFVREDAAHTLAAVLRADLDFSRLPAESPASVRRLLQRCLERDRRQRLHAIADARLELQQAEIERSAPLELDRSRVSKIRVFLLASAAAVLLAVVAALTGWNLKPEPDVANRLVTRLDFALPGASLHDPYQSPRIGLSPDGRSVAFVAFTAAGTQIYVRSVDQLEATPVRGTEGGWSPHYSDDGEWLFFVAKSDSIMGLHDAAIDLMTVPVAGGTASVLAERRTVVAVGRSPDTLVLRDESGMRVTLSQRGALVAGASATGSSSSLAFVRQLEALVASVEPRFSPRMVPGERGVLFFTHAWGKTEICLYSLELGESRSLAEGSEPKLTDSGHLVFVRQNALWAVPFDLEKLQIKGQPVPVVEGIDVNPVGFANYDVRGGSLAYLKRAQAEDGDRLIWVDRSGTEVAIPAPPRLYEYPRLAPDGKSLAVFTRWGTEDLWIWRLGGGTLTRLTFAEGQDGYGVWSPSGRDVYFSSQREAPPPRPNAPATANIYRRRADGTGSVERLTHSSEEEFPSSISADGRYLIYRLGSNTIVGRSRPGGFGLGLLPLEDGGEPRLLLDSEFDEIDGELSPDGRWLAYASNESGRLEIYVRPFPKVDRGRWQVSSAGGETPLWSRKGRELFYRVRAHPSLMMSVRFEVEGLEFRPGVPQVLFEGEHRFGDVSRNYDVSPDGQRFLMVRDGRFEEHGTPRPDLVVVLNFDEELKRLAPIE